MSDSLSVEAITLARAAFSSAQGQLGLIKFSVEELVPVEGTDSKIWNLTCSFYENLGNPTPSKYIAVVNTENKTVSIKKIGGDEPDRKFTVTEEGEGGAENKIDTATTPEEKTTPPILSKS
ncbi:MAG: hypothetical protein WAV23_02070 [Minisyncoccia bacterium]